MQRAAGIGLKDHERGETGAYIGEADSVRRQPVVIWCPDSRSQYRKGIASAHARTVEVLDRDYKDRERSRREVIHILPRSRSDYGLPRVCLVKVSGKALRADLHLGALLSALVKGT
jgi:hypothetical protein